MLTCPNQNLPHTYREREAEGDVHFQLNECVKNAMCLTMNVACIFLLPTHKSAEYQSTYKKSDWRLDERNWNFLKNVSWFHHLMCFSYFMWKWFFFLYNYKICAIDKLSQLRQCCGASIAQRWYVHRFIYMV